MFTYSSARARSRALLQTVAAALLAAPAIAQLGAPAGSHQLGADVELTMHETGPGMLFGATVALDGDRAVVTAPGSAGHTGVYVFERVGDAWEETAKLLPGDPPGNSFGSSVDVSGDRIVVGASRDDEVANDAGAVYVFDLVDGAWLETAKLVTADTEAGDLLGWQVAVEGDRVVASALYGQTPYSSPDVGKVYAFEQEGRVWAETEQIELDGGGYGGDGFGYSLAMSGDVLVIGAPFEKVAGHDRGQAYAYVHSGSGWSAPVPLVATAEYGGQEMGRSVAVHGDLIAVGAPGDGPSLGYDAPGAVYLFRRAGNGWQLEEKLAPAEGLLEFPRFGSSVAVDAKHGRLLATKDASYNAEASVLVFERTRLGWVELGSWDAGATGTYFGSALAMDRGLALVGEHRSDAHGASSGSARMRSSELAKPPLLAAPAHVRFYVVGERQKLALDAGPSVGGQPYAVWGSATGTAPTLVDGGVVPLAFDAYTSDTMLAPGSTPLVGFAGLLDPQGRALAEYVIPPGGLPSNVGGTTLYHAFVVLDPVTLEVTFASNAATLNLVY